MLLFLAPVYFALASRLVNAVDIIAYPNTIACAGANFGCFSIGANVCCTPFPTGYGFSFQVKNLPPGAEAQGFQAPNCLSGTQAFTLFGPGNKCWNGGGGTGIASAYWFFADRKRAPNSIAVECATPNVFSYTDENGVARKIKIPGSTIKAAEEISKLALQNDYTSLEKYEAYV